MGDEPKDTDVLSYRLYPKVFKDFIKHRREYGKVDFLTTPVFFYGLKEGREIETDLEPGKTLVVKFTSVSEPHPDGHRTVFFELNGQPREVTIGKARRSSR